jgi:hypothetical protein
MRVLRARCYVYQLKHNDYAMGAGKVSDVSGVSGWDTARVGAWEDVKVAATSGWRYLIIDIAVGAPEAFVELVMNGAHRVVC